MTAQNKALISRLMDEVVSQGNYDAADGLVDPHFVGHSPTPGFDTEGLEAYKQFFRTMRGAFPDLRIEIHEQLSVDDRVVTRWTARATHLGEFMGLPPSGKQGAMSGINIDRIQNGKVVECWSLSDELGLMRQIGALPQPAGAP